MNTSSTDSSGPCLGIPIEVGSLSTISGEKCIVLKFSGE